MYLHKLSLCVLKKCIFETFFVSLYCHSTFDSFYILLISVKNKYDTGYLFEIHKSVLIDKYVQ